MASSPQWDDCFGYNARWGYVKDATGLYYCQNRYYDPANGRWLTRDPIGYEGGINLYGYCGGGPVGSVDANGHGWRRVVGGIAGGVLAGILSVGNPVAIIAGIGVGGGLGDAGEQAEETGEVNWGKAALAGGADAATAYLGGKLLAPVGRYLGPRVSGLFGRMGWQQAQGVCKFIIEGHHPFAQQLSKAISKAQPALGQSSRVQGSSPP